MNTDRKIYNLKSVNRLEYLDVKSNDTKKNHSEIKLNANAEIQEFLYSMMNIQIEINIPKNQKNVLARSAISN